MNHTVYQHLGKDGKPLYIGLSSNPIMRLSAHEQKEWHNQVSDIKVLQFESEAEARLKEAQLILEHKPPFNHNGKKKPRCVAKRPEGCTYIGAWIPNELHQALCERAEIEFRTISKVIKRSIERTLALPPEL